MTKTKLFHTKNGLPEKTRANVVSVLQDLLASGIDLMLQTKHAHWNVKGPNFIALHQLFDQVHAEVEVFVDSIAERITQFGGVAKGTREMITENSSLPEFPEQASSEKMYVEYLSHSLAFFGELIREGIDQVDEWNDPATVDILTQVSRSVDKNLWFVESHLMDPSGDQKALPRAVKKTNTKEQGLRFSPAKGRKGIDARYSS